MLQYKKSWFSLKIWRSCCWNLKKILKIQFVVFTARILSYNILMRKVDFEYIFCSWMKWVIMEFQKHSQIKITSVERIFILSWIFRETTRFISTLSPCTIFTILLTLWNSEQKKGLLIKLFFVFHLILMNLGEVVVIHVYYNFTNFHQTQMKNKKKFY